MPRVLPYLIAIVVVLSCGLVTGVHANRWHDSTALDSAAERLKRVPMIVGDWLGEDGELPPRIIEQSEVSGYILRRYKNRRTNVVVSVFLGCGRPGPVGVHSPEVCYTGGGYELLDTRKRLSVRVGPESSASEMVSSDFRNPPSQNAGYLRVLWAMSANGVWGVPESPRISYATVPVLFKIYVIRDLANPSIPLEQDPCSDFSRQLLPELATVLFPDPRPAGSHGKPLR